VAPIASCEARYGGVVDTGLNNSKIASPPWAVRRTRNDVEDVSVFCEGNTICSRRGLLILVENKESFQFNTRVGGILMKKVIMAVILMQAGIVFAQPVDEHTLAYWKINEGSGDFVEDSSYGWLTPTVLCGSAFGEGVSSR